MKPLIQVQAVSQRFNTASGEFLALQNVSFVMLPFMLEVSSNARPCSSAR